MKYLVIILIALSTLISVESMEHARLSRGITCELYYIQGQVDAVKSLDLIIQKLEEKKQPNQAEFIRAVQKYQLYVAQLDGTSKCVEIEYSLPEILYERLKGKLSELGK